MCPGIFAGKINDLNGTSEIFMSAKNSPARASAAAKRHALIVLGMHRSGTSAISGVFAKLGAQPPKNLMPPTPDNPLGYWESTEVMKFHDSILESAGSSWSDWESFNSDWLDSPAGLDLQERLSALLEAEYGESRLILVKDPRMCRFFAIWEKALSALGFVSKIVVPVRHPLEVIGSLKKRDNIPSNHARLLWLRHILDAEYSTRNATRVFIRYSDMLRDWQSQVEEISARLEIKWPRMSGSTKAEIDAYLAPELRHHVAPVAGTMASSAGAGIVSWVDAAFRAVECLVDDPGQSEGLATLDAIRRQFNETAGIYAPIVQEQRMGYEKRVARVGDENSELSRELGELKRKHELLDMENLENYRKYAEAEDRASELSKEIRGRETALAEAVSRTDVLQAEVNAKTDLNAEIKRLRDACRQADEAAHERHLEIAELTKLLLETEERLAAERALAQDEIARHKEQLEDALGAVGALQRASGEERARHQAQVEDALRTIRSLQGEIEDQRRLVVDYRSSLDRIHANRYWRVATSLRGLVKAGGGASEPVHEASDEELIAQSALFDKEWYLERYPDVRAAGVDPLAHYLSHGANDGRDPSAAFSTSGYLARYPDVSSLELNPLAHYLRYGRGEGRSISASEPGNGHIGSS